MTTSGVEALPDNGPLERLLAPIADVRRGEALSALLMALTMLLILYAYYLLKTVREVFILAEGGAEGKSYGKLASTVNRVQLIQWGTLFFVTRRRLARRQRWPEPAAAGAGGTGRQGPTLRSER
jgi:hypothetical protein